MRIYEGDGARLELNRREARTIKCDRNVPLSVGSAACIQAINRCLIAQQRAECLPTYDVVANYVYPSVDRRLNRVFAMAGEIMAYEAWQYLQGREAAGLGPFDTDPPEPSVP